MAMFTYDQTRQRAMLARAVQLGLVGPGAGPAQMPQVPSPDDQQTVQDLARQRTAMQGAGPPMGPGYTPPPRDVSEMAGTMAQNGPPTGPGLEGPNHPAPTPPQPLAPNPYTPPMPQPPPYETQYSPDYKADLPALIDRAHGSQGALLGGQQPDQLPFGVTQPTDPNRQLQDANAGALAYSMAGLGGPQPGDDAGPGTGAKSKVSAASHTKAIMAAAQTGDPALMAKSITDPSSVTPSIDDMNAAAALNGGQGAQGAAAGGPRALFPPGALDGTSTAKPQAGSQDKAPGLGSKLSGFLANPDTKDLLLSIGTGLLANRNPMQGLAQGLQTYQGLHLRREERDQKQGNADRAFAQGDKRIALQGQQIAQEGKYQDAELGQGQQRIGLEAQGQADTKDYRAGQLGIQQGDLGLRRDEQAQMAKYRMQSLGVEQSKLAEDRSFHQGSLANDATRAKAALITAQRGGTNPYQQSPDSYYDSQGNLLTGRFNRQTGKTEYVDAQGQPVANPQGLMRAQDSVYKQYARGEGDVFKNVITEGNAAEPVVQRLGYAKDVLAANPTLYTGSGGDVVQAWRKLAVGMGIDPSAVSSAADADAISSIAGQQMLSFVNQTKGSISDYEDRKFLDMAPGLTKTREGNMRLIGMAQRMSQRQVDKRDFFAQRDNLPYREVNSQWEDYQKQHPVFEGMPGFGSSGDKGANSVTVGGLTVNYTVKPTK